MTHGVLRAALNGGERRAHDFYPTEPEPTQALIPLIRHWPRKIWEPFAGDGGIGRPLEVAGFDVVATDLVDRGYGVGGVEFLATTARLADAILTNPPYGRRLLDQVLAHALGLGVPHIAMLLNVNAWSAAKRLALWRARPPAVIYVLTWRVDFTGAGSPYFNSIWTVWEPEPAAFTRIELLERPGQDSGPYTRQLAALAHWNSTAEQINRRILECSR